MTGRNSLDVDEIASSVPEQDGTSARHFTRGRAAKKGRATSSRPSIRTGSTTSGTRVAKKRRVLSSGSKDQLLPKGDDSDDISDAEEEEDGTEPANDQYMEDDVDFEPNIAGPSTRNRRLAHLKATNVISRSSTKVGKKSVKTSSQNDFHSMLSVNFYAVPTKVFALWKDDGYYYSGQIESHQSGSNYVVEFDGLAKRTVELDKMRRCELNVGDNVIVNKTNQKVKVVEIDGDNIVVEMANGTELDQVDYEPRDIRIASRSLGVQWKNRYLDQKAIVTAVDQQKHEGPRSKLLAKTGLLISMSERVENWRHTKEQVLATIKRNGGVAIDDFLDVIDIPGKHSNSQRRWVGEGKDVKWRQKLNLDRVFLLSNDATEKPKYLMSLALGIPCLHVNWLHHFLQHDHTKVSVECYV
jgi:hypothetical protein